jgi:hypothetical protein
VTAATAEFLVRLAPKTRLLSSEIALTAKRLLTALPTRRLRSRLAGPLLARFNGLIALLGKRLLLPAAFGLIAGFFAFTFHLLNSFNSPRLLSAPEQG